MAGGAGGNPGAEGGVFPGIAGKALPAFVRDLGEGFEEDEAAVGFEQVEAAAKLLAGQGGVVKVGVETAEGEFEAALAGGVAMAGAEAATGFGEDGLDIGFEGCGGWGKSVGEEEGGQKQGAA